MRAKRRQGTILGSAYRLNDWTVWPHRNRIEKGGRVVHLAPKTMAVLQCLATASNTVVSRQEIFATVWPKASVSDDALTQRIGELRKAFGDSAHQPQFIETVPKIGFRLIPVPCPLDDQSSGTREFQAGRGRLSPMKLVAALVVMLLTVGLSVWLYRVLQISQVEADRPDEKISIAVLPFADLSESADHGWLADGFSEELLNALAQVPGLRVTARTSSFFFKDTKLPLDDIAARLDVSYVVEGSIRHGENRVRVTVQLIETASEGHVWSDTYEAPLSDVLEAQARTAEQIAAALGLMLNDTARRRMSDIGINDPQTYIAYQKGLEAFQKAHDGSAPVSEQLALANEFFDQVLLNNPRQTSARILRTDRVTHIVGELVDSGRAAENPEEAVSLIQGLKEEFRLAWRLAPPGSQRDMIKVQELLYGDDWSGLSDLVQVALQPGNCPTLNIAELLSAFGWADEMVAYWRRAEACDPLNADTVTRLAKALVWARRPEEAIEVLDRAERRGISEDRFLLRRCQAMIAIGKLHEPGMERCWSMRHWKLMQLNYLLILGRGAQARQLAEGYLADSSIGLDQSLDFSDFLGDRERANAFAARIDASPGGPFRLASHVFSCHCGAPFDLDATPVFKERLREAGFHWPPEVTARWPYLDR